MCTIVNERDRSTNNNGHEKLATIRWSDGNWKLEGLLHMEVTHWMESTSQRGSYHVGEGNTGGVYVAYLKKKKKSFRKRCVRVRDMRLIKKNTMETPYPQWCYCRWHCLVTSMTASKKCHLTRLKLCSFQCFTCLLDVLLCRYWAMSTKLGHKSNRSIWNPNPQTKLKRRQNYLIGRRSRVATLASHSIMLEQGKIA